MSIADKINNSSEPLSRYNILKSDEEYYHKLIAALKKDLKNNKSLSLLNELINLLDKDYHTKFAKQVNLKQNITEQLIKYFTKESAQVIIYDLGSFASKSIVIRQNGKFKVADGNDSKEVNDLLSSMIIEVVDLAFNYLNEQPYFNNLKINKRSSESDKAIYKYHKVEFLKLCFNNLQSKYLYNKTVKFRKSFSFEKLDVIIGMIVISLKPDMFKVFEDSIKGNLELKPAEIKSRVNYYTREWRKSSLSKK